MKIAFNFLEMNIKKVYTHPLRDIRLFVCMGGGCNLNPLYGLLNNSQISFGLRHYVEKNKKRRNIVQQPC